MREEREQAFYEAIGHIIKVRRTDLEMDRKELADRADISYSYLAAIENGHKRPSSTVLLSLAEALGLTPSGLFETAERRLRGERPVTQEYPGWLVAGAEVPAAPSAQLAYMRAAPLSPKSFTEELAGVAEDLDDRDKRVLLELARKMAGR